MKTVYDFTVKDRMGNDVSLKDYEGKVLLIVNTATGCGFTPHYEPLEAMYKDMKDQGFEILDFPCNQFANQAPGSDDEIHEFCTLKFGTEFPQFAKIDVNGETADPLFAYLASEKPFEGFGKGLKNAALNKFAAANNKKYGDKTYIGWNFTKFLVDREGKVIARFEPTEDMQDVRNAVVEAQKCGIHVIGMYMFDGQSEIETQKFLEMYAPYAMITDLDELETEIPRVVKNAFLKK